MVAPTLKPQQLKPINELRSPKVGAKQVQKKILDSEPMPKNMPPTRELSPEVEVKKVFVSRNKEPYKSNTKKNTLNDLETENFNLVEYGPDSIDFRTSKNASLFKKKN